MPIRINAQEIDLEELLHEWKRDIFLTLNCHAIARVEEFDSSNQTVKASILYPQTYFILESDNKYREDLIDYPILIDVPVVVLKGGQVSLKMPIASGDECVVLFNDRSLDAWFTSGNKQRLDSERLHSFSDGIALVGVSSLAQSISGHEDGKAVLGDNTSKVSVGSGSAALVAGGATVSVGGGQVDISGGGTDLKSILTDVVTALASVGAPQTVNITSKINTLLKG